MHVGQRGSKGEVYQRCDECGDSVKNPRHCHKAVYADGSTFCFRCGHSTRLSLEALMAIVNGDCTVDEALDGEWEPPTVLRKNSGRRSALPKFYPDDCFEADTFEMRTCNGKVTGYYHRYPGKRSIVDGKAGIGFVGDKLTSSPSRPLTVYESPYDCLVDTDCCVFGMLSKGRLKHFRLQYVFLYPDADCLDTTDKRQKFIEKVVKPSLDMSVFVLGVIVANGDNDEATIRIHVPTENALRGDWGEVGWWE